MINVSTLREKRASGEDGFTLIELLVVVVIIGILIAIAIPVYLNYQKGANDKATQSDLRNAVNTLEQCNTDKGNYPVQADFPLTGSATGSCPNQTINASSGTTWKYVATGTAPTSYMLVATNTKGNNKLYCYNSTKGGSITDVSSATNTTLANTTC